MGLALLFGQFPASSEWDDLWSLESGGGSKLIEHVFPFNLSVLLIFNDRERLFSAIG